jgi:hypothetical protein
LGGSVKFFKPKDNNEFKEGDRIIRIEFYRVVAYVLGSKSGERVLGWVYVGIIEINFISKI